MGQFLSKEEVSSYSPSDGDWELYEKARKAFTIELPYWDAFVYQYKAVAKFCSTPSP